MSKLNIILIIIIVILSIFLAITTFGLFNFKNASNLNYQIYEQSQNTVKRLENELDYEKSINHENSTQE